MARFDGPARWFLRRLPRRLATLSLLGCVALLAACGAGPSTLDPHGPGAAQIATL